MLKKIIIVIAVILFFLIVSKFSSKAIKLSSFLFQLVFNTNVELKKTDNNINLLLLGIGGGSHEGPNLTDTIIFASIDQVKNKVTLVSIPRDLWIPDLQSKINSAYAFGEDKRQGGGILLVNKIVSKVVGKDINYVVRVNFDGFVKTIDLFGGIDINIENSFNDYEYPIEGKENDLCGYKEEDLATLLATSSSQLATFPCRYMNLHVDKGLQRLDGTKALQIVRSRHAAGEEGTDFTRSKRQEAIIKAVKNKILSSQFLLNPTKLIGFYNVIKDNMDTDIQENEFDDFIRLFQKMKNASINTLVLDYGDDKAGRAGFLVNPPLNAEFNYAWVLIPRTGNGNFSEIQKYVDCEIKIGNCPITQN